MNSLTEQEHENPFDPVDEEIVGDWLGKLDVSSKTRETYRAGFKSFCEFVKMSGLPFDDLKQHNVVDFKFYLLLEREMEPSTVSTYLAAVRSFYAYAEHVGGQSNVARGVRGAAQKKGFKKEALTPGQVREMLGCIDRDSEAGLRDYAMLNLMVRCGLRDIEVVRANVGDVTKKAGCDVLLLHGKGRAEKDDFVVLTQDALSPIQTYLKSRTYSGPDEPLFASVSRNNEGGRLTTRSVSQTAKKAMAQAGIVGKQYTAHSLRHTAVTLALLGGATEREAQLMARHADINTTMTYSHHIDRIQHAAEYRVDSVLRDS